MLEDIEPVREAGLIDFVDGAAGVADGIQVELTGGHCPGHQILRVCSGGQTLLCPGELIPTCWHMRPAWVMSYDEEPVRVAELKERLLREVVVDNTLLFLGHEPGQPFGRISQNSTGYSWVAAPEATMQD